MNKAQAELQGGLEALSEKAIKVTTVRLIHRGPNAPTMTPLELVEEIQKLESKNYTLVEDYRKLKKEHDRQKKGYEMSIQSCEELEQDVEGLVKERDELKAEVKLVKFDRDTTEQQYQKHAKRRIEAEDELNELREATAGHSPANLKEIIKAMPPALSLEGYKLEYRIVEEGEEWWHEGYREWRTFNIGPAPSSLPTLVRTPIVEWIVCDAITDAMVIAAGGRVPCEVWRGNSAPMPTVLLKVAKNFGFITEPVDNGTLFGNCRIKKSDLKVSE